MQIRKTTAYIILSIFIVTILAMGAYLYSLKTSYERDERSFSQTIQSLRNDLYNAERTRDSVRTAYYELYSKVHPQRSLSDILGDALNPGTSTNHEKRQNTVYAFAEITVISVNAYSKTESYVSNVFEMSGDSDDIIARMRDNAEEKIGYKLSSSDKPLTKIHHYSSYKEASEMRHMLITSSSSTNTFDMSVY